MIQKNEFTLQKFAVVQKIQGQKDWVIYPHFIQIKLFAHESFKKDQVWASISFLQLKANYS